MRWKGLRQSENVEDRRGMSGRKIAFGGGIGTIVIVLIVLFLGGDPGQILNLAVEDNQVQAPGEILKDDTMAQFIAVVLAETEDTWNRIFSESGRAYRAPKLVLYSGQVQSACGFNSAATGPFYCPGDEKVYIDLSFCEELKTRFGAPGDFAIAYVVAHEVGHHVQKLLGTLDEVNGLRNRMDEKEFNRYLVRLELQADYYSGIWAHDADQWKGILEPGDAEEAISAAGAVGDDRLQKQAQGYIVPDAFTHGTSEQRMRWFKKGYDSGNPAAFDPFEVRSEDAL
ncbi:MAG TPA: neutral zinc metallopeptidase [Bacteroidales bacterium]|nr:neutral zinc metallopeptidase [Bacteroidales bacterium]HSA42377.1 neutral zinc metallopeptidase [Bacteroidales bacterium]